MQPESPSAYEGQIAVFYQRHRTGLVTLVFTDLVDSVALRRQLGDQAGTSLLQAHRQLVRQTLARFPEAEEIETAGDSFLLLFARPSDAVKFALLVQRQTRTLAGERDVRLADRIGIHVGEIVIEEHEHGTKPKDVYGTQIDLCARVMGLAEGGQILLTRAVFDSARQALKGEDIEGVQDLSWLNHGPYLLKGIEESVEVCEVGEVGIALLQSPAGSEKAQRQVAPGSEPVLGWRPAVGQLVPNTKWVLEQKLGEGGFGEVWLGCQRTTKERRVFKFCFQAERVRFLKRELTLFRLLKERVGDHPNIVRLHDIYLDQAPFYVEMDYVEGRDLRSWSEGVVGSVSIGGSVERGDPASPGATPGQGVALEVRLEIVAQVAEALQAAHDAGVIHRDVKPGNILVGDQRSEVRGQPGSQLRAPAPVVKLTDFGIGQVVSEEYLSGITRAGFTQTILSDSSSSHTGTQIYMAPELLAGKPASIRSDIYSLGVVLYQLLVGDFSRPVATDWANDISDPLLRDDLKHCFAGNPNDRFAGAGQLAKNLRELPQRQRALAEQQAALAARECAAYRRGIVRAAAVAVLIVAVIGLLALHASNQSRVAKTEAQRARRSAKEVELQRERAEENSLRLKIQRAEDFFAADNSSTALAYLAQVLRQSPTNRVAAQRLISALSQRNFPLPAGESLNHLDTVRFAEYSPDGQRIATASADRTARVWDASTGQPLAPPLRHNDAVITARFSPDGARLVTASLDKTARVWDARTGLALTEPLPHSEPVYSAMFSPDGKQIATSATYSWARLWDARTGQPLTERLIHGNGVFAAQFSPNGKLLVTASADGTAKVWDTRTGQLLHEKIRHGSFVVFAQFSPDGQRIVTASWDRTARVWDAQTGEPVTGPLQHENWVFCAQFSPDGQRVVTHSQDNTARMWDALTGQALTNPFRYAAGVRSSGYPPRYVQFTPEGQGVVTANWDNTARLWDARTGQPLSEPLRHHREVFSAQLSPDGEHLVTASADRTARLWDVREGRIMAEPLEHNGEVVCAQFSPDGQKVATASEDRSAWIWDVQTGLPIAGPLRHDDFVLTVQFSPDGQEVVTASYDHTARIWDARNGAPLTGLLWHDDVIRCVQFSPDGLQVVTASDDGTAKVWDARSGKPIAPALHHQTNVVYAEFSPSGKQVVTASADKTARIWDSRTGKATTESLRHRDGVNTAQFSPDGRLVVTASADNTARVWDAQSGQPVTEPFRHEAGINLARFSPNGQRVVTASADHTARVWELPPTQLPVPAWLAELAEALAAQRIGEQSASEFVSAEEVLKLKRRLEGGSATDPYTRWAKWFFAERGSRTLSPGYPITVPEYVRRRSEEPPTYSFAMTEGFDVPQYVRVRAAQNRINALREAMRMSPASPLVFARLARHLTMQNPAQSGDVPATRANTWQNSVPTLDLAEADWSSRWAMELSPEAPEVWWARAEVLGQSGKIVEALDQIDRAIQRQPQNPEFWNAKGWMLEATNRLNEAFQAYSKAIELAAAKGNASSNARTKALLNRRRLLRRQNRLAEANLDLCAAKAELLMPVTIPHREKNDRPDLIDLSEHVNVMLTETPTWFEGILKHRDYGSLPRGIQKLAGVDFDLRGYIRFLDYQEPNTRASHPDIVADILVSQKCNQLHFLQSNPLRAQMAGSAAERTPKGEYVVHYAEGAEEHIPIPADPDPTGVTQGGEGNAAVVLAWEGTNEVLKERAKVRRFVTKLRLFKMTWKNPHPEREIKSLDAIAESGLLLFAITVE